MSAMRSIVTANWFLLLLKTMKISVCLGACSHGNAVNFFEVDPDVAVAGDLNNRDINDDNCAQELSADEIRRLKEDGLAGQVCPFALPLMLGC